MTTPIHVLFVCIHNSARSQMAEAFLQHLGNGRFEAESAGLEPGKLNPIVVTVMQEIGIDISHKSTKDVFSLYQQGKAYDAVITVCDAANAERCPVFPGKAQKIAWSFPDPSQLQGASSDVLANTRLIRDEIKAQIQSFISTWPSDPE